MSSLNIIVTEDNSTINALLEGQINEDSDFTSFENLKGDKLILNLRNVTHINSCGIRDWVEIQKKYFNFSKVIYQECPQVIIEQMNIVSGFIHANGEIESFYAPYYNEEKDEEVKILLTPSEVSNSKAPSKKDADGNELEFDDIEIQYFSFLKK